MNLAAVLFAIAAVLGVSIAVIRLKGRDLPPMWLALLHGAFAASGLVALALAVLNTGGSDLAKYALIGFVFAALGGFFLFSFHLRRKALPIPIIGIHAVVAVISFGILLFAIFG